MHSQRDINICTERKKKLVQIEESYNATWALRRSYMDRVAKLAIKNPEYLQKEAELARERTEAYVAAPPGYDYAVGKKRSANGLIAVIPIMGVMSRYGNWCSWGTEDIASWVMEAAEDEEISGIVLEANTPGGEASGIELLSTAIEQCKKPVVGYVGNAAYSGGTWALALCDRIMVESATISGMGSIGVYTMHIDYVEMLKKEGIAAEIIRAEGSEKKVLSNSYETLSDEARLELVAEVTAIRETFVSIVKKGRGNLADDVFSGKTFNGKACLEVGLADEIGFMGDAVALADRLS